MSETGGEDLRPMAGGPGDPVASEAMEISPSLDAIPARPDAGPGEGSAAAPVEPDEEVTAEQVSLSRRLRQPRTIISIIIPLVIIAAFIGINGAALAKVPGLIAGANPVLVAAAFGIFYLGFPLRGWRWRALLRGTDFIIGTKDSTVIIFLSWLVNCVVPAKLGDVYRAYLLKINSTASLSKTFGTVFIERVLDVIAIALLGILAGYWSFRDGLPPAVQVVFAIGLAVVILLVFGLFTMRNFGRKILTILPLPHRVIELYDKFEVGVFGALRLRQMPFLGTVTVMIWMTESLRLYFVVLALGFPDVELGISGAVFVALIGSLLTAVPLSPAGLGIVEAGVVGVLTVAYGVPLPEATAIALLDRVISVFSVIVLGSIAYLFSKKPEGLDPILQPGETVAQVMRAQV